MKVIQVDAERSYSVFIDTNWKDSLQDLFEGRERVAVFFSESMKMSIPQFECGDTEFFYFPVPDSEGAKSTKVLMQVWDWLGAAGFTRTDLIIGIGGGAVTDFSGFAAASWLRGLDWVAVPTTVAGMVDAAVGGKTGINSDYGKNLIGAFHSPIAVIVDSRWLETLSDRDFAAGLAEVVKTGFISDFKILEIMDGKSLSEIRQSSALTIELVERSIAVKAKVVSGDFKESFDREILNYGHTFGHAVELHSKYALRHGESVSIGLVFIAELLFELGLIDSDLVKMHRRLLENLNLPISYKDGVWPDLLAHMRMDKKSRGNILRFVGITGIGKTQRVEAPPESALLKAYERVSK